MTKRFLSLLGFAGLAVSAQAVGKSPHDFETEVKPLSRIKKISGANLHRNWVMIPHVTQWDNADITEVEAFRKEQNVMAEKKKMGVKITPLVFVMKAVAKALEKYEVFNSSLSDDGESLIIKKFINIGIAEQNMIGVASGLAMEGKIVFVFISINFFVFTKCYL